MEDVGDARQAASRADDAADLSRDRPGTPCDGLGRCRGSTVPFAADSDPARRVIGPARERHPSEIVEIRRDMENSGARIIEIPNRDDMAYSSRSGSIDPQLTMNPNASYIA